MIGLCAASEIVKRADRHFRVFTFLSQAALVTDHASKPQTPKLFATYPAEDQTHLIMRWGSRTDERLSSEFADAANRLAASYTAEPVDDLILLPWLYLYRHAIELALKSGIVYAARLRKNNGEDDERLAVENVAIRLETKHRHSVGALVHEANEHFEVLGLQTIPKAANKTLQLLAEMDPRGEAFRYSGDLPATYDHINFEQLSQAMEHAYQMITAGVGLLDSYAENQDAALETGREMRREFEAEMDANRY